MEGLGHQLAGVPCLQPHKTYQSLFSVMYSESSENYLLNLFSRGRFSVVKKCDQKGTKRAVATKFVNKKLMKRDQVTHELGILQNLQHPLLIGLLDTFETPTSYVLVLEMCVHTHFLPQFVSLRLNFQ